MALLQAARLPPGPTSPTGRCRFRPSDHAAAAAAGCHMRKTMILNMDAHRPWVIKDPRLCVTLPYWKKLLEVPVCVIVYRDPLEIAESLQNRAETIPWPLDRGIAPCGNFTRAGMLNATAGLPRIFVSALADFLHRKPRQHATMRNSITLLKSPRRPRPAPALHPRNHRLHRPETLPLQSSTPESLPGQPFTLPSSNAHTGGHDARRLRAQRRTCRVSAPKPSAYCSEQPYSSGNPDPYDHARRTPPPPAHRRRHRAAEAAAGAAKSKSNPPKPMSGTATRKTLLTPCTRYQRAYRPKPLLQGIDQSRDTLLANTFQFARGHSANNALLWGARGMGKSSLVKAIHAHINKQLPKSLVLIEIHREDIATPAPSSSTCCAAG